MEATNDSKDSKSKACSNYPTDLACDDNFARSVAREIVPWVQKRYRVTPSPKRTIVCGLSLGGLMAAFSALRYPNVFGNVLSQSGSFWYFKGWSMTAPPQPFGHETGWLATQYAQSPRLPIKFYLDVGRLEQFIEDNQLIENRRMRDVLLAKGYSVTYAETSTGHDGLAWRETLADGLLALAGHGCHSKC